MSSCFVCKKKGNLKNLTDDKMLKCRKMLAFRKKKFYKYGDIELPVTLCQKGYHIDCYNRFIVLKRRNKEEFDAMFITTTFDGQDPIITTTPSLETDANDDSSEDTSSNNDIDQNSIELQLTSRPLEMCPIRNEIEDSQDNSDIEIENHEIKEEIPEVSIMDNPFSNYGDESSYLTPDISRGVILKSLLTRKSPVKKVITKDQFSFDSGMKFYTPNFKSLPFDHVATIKPTLEPVIMNTVSLAETGVCIFCDKRERQIGTQREFPVIVREEIYEKILSSAESINNTELLEKFKDEKTFSFHPLCRTENRNKCGKLTRKNLDDQDWSVFKNLHAEAFEGICAFIDDKIIDKHKTYYLSDLYERYKALLYEIQDSETPFDFEGYSPQNLQEKILNRYYGIVEIATSKSLKRKIVYKSDLKTNLYSPIVQNDDLKYDKLAFELRRSIKSLKRNSGEAESIDIPEKLQRFIGTLIQGPDVRKVITNNESVQIKSLCENIVERIIAD